MIENLDLFTLANEIGDPVEGNVALGLGIVEFSIGITFDYYHRHKPVLEELAVSLGSFQLREL